MIINYIIKFLFNIQDWSFLYINSGSPAIFEDKYFTRMWKTLACPLILLRGEVWVYKTNLTPPLYIEVHVCILSQEIKWSCLCVLQYSQRHTMINHCDRRITHLGDILVILIYLLFCLIYLQNFFCI